MSTQTVTRTQAPEETTIPHEADLHVRLAELLANVQPPADVLQEFYARVLPRGAAPVACRPFWPCA